MEVNIEQYSIIIVDLNPTRGTEMGKTRPCVVISPNSINHNINNVIVAPLTSTDNGYPTRVEINRESRGVSYVALDQIRTVTKERLRNTDEVISDDEIANIKTIIKEMLVD